MQKYHLILKVVVAMILPMTTLAVTCDSRFYCKTLEVKYVSMDKLTNVALNGTVIKSVQAKDISGCQRSCLQEENCRSMNVNASTAAGLTCDFLDVNIYSNASLLLQQNGSIHLYIPSKCRKNPCKNEAVCVPHYKNDSYQCECKSNGTWITSGVHCEKALSGYSTAFLYWSFNDRASNAPSTSTGQVFSSYTLGWDPVSDPGRRYPVVICKDGASCIQIWKGIPCINSFSQCRPVVTYSIWIKFTEYEAKRARSHLLLSYAYGGRTGIKFRTTRTGGFEWAIAISTNKRWEIAEFGTTVIRTRWNQFTIVVDNDRGVCAFVNGVKDVCQHSHTPVALVDHSNGALRVGGAWYAGSEPDVFLDDFAIWRAALTPTEVKNMFEQSKGRKA